jgi:hypothetical protein
VRPLLYLEHHDGYASLLIRKTPLPVCAASTIYDLADRATGHRLCNTRLSLWLIRTEDRVSRDYRVPLASTLAAGDLAEFLWGSCDDAGGADDLWPDEDTPADARADRAQ